MKSLDQFLKSINPYAPTCAIPTAYFGIRQAAIEFCMRTRTWRHEAEVTITANETVAIPVLTDSVLLDFENITFEKGVPLEAKTPKWLDDNCKGWRTGELTGIPQYFTQLDQNTIRVVPAQAGTLQISMWLKPSQECTTVPDFLPDQYREPIAWGALGRILMTPNQPYTNAGLATAFLAQFEGKLAALSNAGITGQQRARHRSRGVYM